MNSNLAYRFHTRVIHAAQKPSEWQGASLPPIFQNAAHRHATAENLSDTFSGKTTDHIYMRLTNPTNRVLEEKLCALEGGIGAVVMASGMAAVTNTCLSLLRTGDEFVAGNSLFMSTYLLFNGIFKKFGITARLVDSSRPEELEAAINDKTRLVFLETIGNPKMDVPDLSRAAEISHGYGIPLVVDNTLATPYLCRPLELGADAVIHSTTKYLSGHGAATGGAVIVGDLSQWDPEKFPDFKPFIERKGNLALMDKIWREHHINFGSTQAPFHSYLTMIGLDTLALRMERHMENTLATATFLQTRPEVAWVNYSGIESHPCFEVASRQFEKKGYGGLLTFGLKNQNECFQFIKNLKLIYHLANLGDCKTLVIHPYSSQYVSFTEETKAKLDIQPNMIRLSVGIEAVEDICEDIAQSLNTLKR